MIPVFETETFKTILLASYCVECEEDTAEPRASYIYQGNSLCEYHFREAKRICNESKEV